MRLRRTLFLTSSLLVAAVLMSASSGYFEISKNIDIFISLYKKVDELYVDDVDHSRIMRKGIDAMLAELDPYTVYYSESQVEDFKFQQTGSYGGIGARIGLHGDKLVVTEIYENSPSQTAGLMPGDILLEVDGKDLSGKNVGDLSELLKGEENTEVKIKLSRLGTSSELNIERAEIKVDNVSYAGMLTDKVGYVKFENFRMDAAKEVKDNMEKMKGEGMEQFVLDMRGNPGGLLKEAVDIVNLFVGENQMVVNTKGKNPDHSREYKTYKRPYDKDIQVVVLVDEGSASASEIVGASLQDYDRGVVIGRNSFGKGLVQITQMLSYNSQLKVTTSKYYTASGRCVQRLDYASRDEDGKVPAVPDSLITEYRTESGRLVYDGAGVNPDLLIEVPENSPYVRALLSDKLVFDFAAQFHYENAEIAPLREFEVSDAMLDAFKKYLESRDFEYKTKTQKKLLALNSTLSGNKDSLAIKAKVEEMNSFLQSLKANDFEKDKEVIRDLLKQEVITMYYYRRGKAEAALQDDPDIEEALKVFADPRLYESILKPA